MPLLRSSSRTSADPVTPVELPPDAGEILLPLARAAIAADLGVLLPFDDSPSWLQQRGSCFVTLATYGELSGCIGTTTPIRTLLEDVTGNARSAAFRDPRFLPLTREDLDATTIEVSVLSPTVPLDFADEADALAQLRPGVDGVVLTCAGRRATFLPQVWERVPDPKQFLAHLKRKLGVAPTFWSDEITLSRYTVSVFSEEARR